MMGVPAPPRVTLDAITDAMALVGQHGVTAKPAQLASRDGYSVVMRA